MIIVEKLKFLGDFPRKQLRSDMINNVSKISISDIILPILGNIFHPNTGPGLIAVVVRTTGETSATTTAIAKRATNVVPASHKLLCVDAEKVVHRLVLLPQLRQRR